MKTLVCTALASLMLLVAAGCNTDQLPPPAGFTNVSGTIVDAATGKPVAGAVVTIDTVLTATTDASGKFAIDKVPSGTVDYVVQAQGYKVSSASTNVEPGKPYVLNVSLTASQ